MANRKLPTSRKRLYYIGMALIILGIILYIVAAYRTHQSFSNSFNNPFPFIRSGRAKVHSPILGAILGIIGAIMMIIGRRGLSGTGIILSPEGERKDMEPWNRSKGRQIQDMLEETKLDELIGSKVETQEVIRLKCQTCEALNNEESKFCDQCGAEF